MNTAPTVASGACLCRAVGFVATLPSRWVAHCHCSRCRRAHGAAFVTFVGLENQPTYQQIAEAAYHRYLNRGGRDGQDFDDWIEAERSLKNR